MNHDSIKSLVSSGFSLLSTVAVWQEQMQFALAIMVSVLSGTASALAIYYAIRSHRKDK
jgi:hypothetical protein